MSGEDRYITDDLSDMDTKELTQGNGFCGCTKSWIPVQAI